MIETNYTKLFASLVTSTIWREDDKTRLVWITMLAMKNRFGEVAGTVPGLAALANVSLQDCEAALAKLLAPDKYSRSRHHEGRRIQEVDGGWLILNHHTYRQVLSHDERREYMRNYMKERRKREKERSSCKPTCKQASADVTHTDPDTDTDSDTKGKERGEVNGETAASPPPLNHPTVEEAIAYFTAEDHGAYPPAEVRKAFASLQAATDDVGNWYWGKRLVTDWRAAMESRMQDNRGSAPGGGSATAQAILAEKELGRVEKRMSDIRGSYETHHDMGDKDRAELKELGARRKELKAKLGFKA